MEDNERLASNKRYLNMYVSIIVKTINFRAGAVVAGNTVRIVLFMCGGGVCILYDGAAQH